MTELPASVAAFRARHRAHDIGPRYRGWLHFATTTVGSAAVIAFCAWRIAEPTVIELAMIPVIFLFANLVEYFGHRGPMHHRSARLAEPLFHERLHAARVGLGDGRVAGWAIDTRVRLVPLLR